MKIYYLLVISILIFCSSCGSSSSQSYEEQKMSIEEIERMTPSDFLYVEGNYKENFWGDKMNINGNIISKATVANYKDAVIEVIFYSETETELQREQYIIYDYYKPNSKMSFTLKVNRPQACKKIGLNVVSATAL